MTEIRNTKSFKTTNRQRIKMLDLQNTEQNENTKYCPDCGSKLSIENVFEKHWTTYFKCLNCREAYIQIDDMRNIYNLCKIHDRRAQHVLKNLKESELNESFKYLKPVDCYNLQTQQFENALISLWHKMKKQD